MVGRALAHYRIIEKLGEGGMGVVYKAHDSRLDRPVAIKILPPGKVDDAGRKQRFVQEAKAASALNHPNIVTIHDIRSDGETDFIVMEHIQGRTLEELIPPEGLRPRQALHYAVQMADALAVAHAAGIVHRDLKPSNVMVTGEGRVKILDFGLAKLLEPALHSPGSPTLTVRALTEAGTVLGTAAYMSPEQAEGLDVDERSDIFSFGAVLYQMVTGRQPFAGDSQLLLLTKILSEDPKPPHEAGAAIPPELERIILRCLRKDPARRYQHMADLKVALEDVQEEVARGKQVRAPSWRRWALAALLPALLLAVFFAGRTWLAPQPVELLRTVALTTFPGAELYPSIAPDGNHVAFTWNGPRQDNPDVYVQMIGSGSPLRLTTDPQADYNPVWSPDGRWIAFLRRSQTGKSELRLIPPLSGPERKLAEIRVPEVLFNWMCISWCPDSNCLVVTDFPAEGQPGALFVISLESGEKRRLTNPQSPVLWDITPAVSPDGSSVVFHRNITGAGQLYLLPLRKDLTAGGEPRRLTPAALSATYPAWMPDGKELLFSARGNLWRLAVPPEGPPARLPFVGEDGSMPVVSRPQPGRLPRLIYVRSFADSNIWRVETPAPGAPSSSPPVISISSTRGETNAQFAPDGRKVAFASNRSGDWEIWVSDPDGGNAVQVTSMGAHMTGTPRWSPDGQMIAFDSNLEGQFEIYAVPAAGGRPRRVTSHPANEHVPSFSRDGKWIYFSSNRTGAIQIWKVPAEGGEAIQVTRNGGYVALDSPDGGHLYYTQTAGPASAVWRLAASGGEPVKVLDRVVRRAFVVLERGIYYLDQPESEARLQFFDIATGRSTTVARDLGDIRLGLSASPDGRTIVYTRVDSSIDDLMLVENFR